DQAGAAVPQNHVLAVEVLGVVSGGVEPAARKNDTAAGVSRSSAEGPGDARRGQSGDEHGDETDASAGSPGVTVEPRAGRGRAGGRNLGVGVESDHGGGLLPGRTGRQPVWGQARATATPLDGRAFVGSGDRYWGYLGPPSRAGHLRTCTSGGTGLVPG